jgi:sugar lactone lactonase YvrE
MALLASASAILATACAVAPGIGTPTAGLPSDPLVPQGVIPGGFAVAPGTAPGVPPGMPPGMVPGMVPGQDVAPGPTGQPPRGQYIKILYPSAVAASGPHLYVADSGSGSLLRIDTITQAVARLGQLPRLPRVRLTSGRDGSVYVLRPDRGEVLRFAPGGQLLASFSAPFDILHPSDLVIEPILNRVWIADSAGGVFAFHPSGRMSEPLVGRGDGFALPGAGATLLAAGERAVVGIDPRCRCVLGFDSDGQVRARFGEGELVNPAGLALDHHGRTWVIDRGDGRLKIFEGTRLAHALVAPRLGLTEFTAIAIDQQRVYLADGPGGKIGVFALLPPRKTP